jgi:hypothetical protein
MSTNSLLQISLSALFAFSSCSDSENTVIDNRLVDRITNGKSEALHVAMYAMPPYEEEEGIPSFDNIISKEIEGLSVDATITFTKDSICRIDNKYHDLFSGFKVSIDINKNLKVVDVSYQQWSDSDNGSETIVTVENIIIQLSKDPFKSSSDIFGRYTLLLKSEFLAGDFSIEGVRDTVYYSVFPGKFKIYSAQDMEKGYTEVMKEYNESSMKKNE